MVNLFERYYKVKTAVSGNREKNGFEYTFGMPMEELYRITPVNKKTTRILSELAFVLKLYQQDGSFEAPLFDAITVLEESLKAEGVVTNSAACKAENCLLPAQDTAKEYEVICAAHAHIDMNWMWGWQETVAATLATFRTMLDLMDEYEDFCFSQSQASVYKIVEDFDPELMERIKQRMKEGRWEVTASAWVEPDKNMPDTESMLRHIKYTRDYLTEHWGVKGESLNIDFVPDTFGHNRNVPEIDRFGNVKYMYHCRGLEGDYALYRYRAPSKAEVLCYREQYWYNSAITPHIGIGMVEIAKRQAGLKTGIVVYGVGDHGGGPSRRDLEWVKELQGWPVFPRIKFGTFGEFFAKAEQVREKLPIVDHEMNYYAPGCYTSQSRIKRANRKTELALEEAEKMSALSALAVGTPFAPKQFERAWQNVLFTHFHDILTGTCVIDAKEHAMGLFSEADAVANTQHNNAMRSIAEKIDTARFIKPEDIESYKSSQAFGAGAGYGIKSYCGVPSPELASGKRRMLHIFNSLAQKRAGLCEVTLWDWSGDLKRLCVTDTAGNQVPFSVVDQELQTFWDHKFVRLLVEAEVPPMGYTTLILDEAVSEEYPFYYLAQRRVFVWDENPVLENDRVKAVFDKHSGGLCSYIDKETGKELIKEGEKAGLCIVNTEKASSNAWQIGKHFKLLPLENVTKLEAFAYNSLRTGFTMELSFLQSTAKVTVSLDSQSNALCYELEVDWNEAGGNPVPVLLYNLPLSYKPTGILCDIPGGAIVRKEHNADVPALKYAMAVSKGTCAALVTDSKYGYRGVDGRLLATLINPTPYPDPYPERYVHTIKLWVLAAEPNPAEMEATALSLNLPFAYLSMNPHKGELPTENSLCVCEAGSAVLSGMYQKGKSLFVRFYETAGESTQIKLALCKKAKNAFYTDLDEKELAQAEVEDGTVFAKIDANKLMMLRIDF